MADGKPPIKSPVPGEIVQVCLNGTRVLGEHGNLPAIVLYAQSRYDGSAPIVDLWVFDENGGFPALGTRHESEQPTPGHWRYPR